MLHTTMYDIRFITENEDYIDNFQAASVPPYKKGQIISIENKTRDLPGDFTATKSEIRNFKIIDMKHSLVIVRDLCGKISYPKVEVYLKEINNEKGFKRDDFFDSIIHDDSKFANWFWGKTELY